MTATPKSVGMIAIVLFSGYNALLMVVIGMLMTIAEGSSGLRVWLILGGLLLIVLGVLFSIGIYGLWTSRMMGRKLLFWCIFASLPLHVIAIFPIFQNEQITIGNTLLQSICILTSLGALNGLRRRRIEAVVEHSDRFPDDGAFNEDDQAPAFTFDRNARENDLFP